MSGIGKELCCCVIKALEVFEDISMGIVHSISLEQASLYAKSYPGHLEEREG